MKLAQLEILLFTDTRFSLRQLYEKYDICSQNNSAENKSLEEACLNGFFQQMLPELYKKVRNGKKPILWKITQAEHFLELEYGSNRE